MSLTPIERSQFGHAELCLSNAKILTFVRRKLLVGFVESNDYQFVCECVACDQLDSCYEEPTQSGLPMLVVMPICWDCAPQFTGWGLCEILEAD